MIIQRIMAEINKIKYLYGIRAHRKIFSKKYQSNGVLIFETR